MANRMFKYRLYPIRAHTKLLEEQLELCRQTHNLLLDYCKQQYKENGKTPTQFDLNNLLINLKQIRPEISLVFSQVLQNIAKRIKDAYTGFFARRRAGLRAGLPRFKGYGRYKSITYPQSGFKVKGDGLRLSKIGSIKIRQHRELPESVKTLTLKRMPSGKWFAVFSCLVEEQPREKPVKEVGIDVGLKSFAVLSDRTAVENPRYYRKGEGRLRRTQRGLSRKERGSRNWVKAKTKVARLHERVQNRRSDFLHKASRKITDKYGTVYVEGLKIRNMVRNHSLAKSISDASWGRFTQMLAYKEEESGGRVVSVNPWGTTQRCSRCGMVVEKALSDRIHSCPYCGLVMDRDLNAALNILERGREIGRGPPEYRPVEEGASTPLGQARPMNQEASLLVGR